MAGGLRNGAGGPVGVGTERLWRPEAASRVEDGQEAQQEGVERARREQGNRRGRKALLIQGPAPGAPGSTVLGLSLTPGGLGEGACCWGEGLGPQHLLWLSSICALGTRTQGHPPRQGGTALGLWKKIPKGPGQHSLEARGRAGVIIGSQEGVVGCLCPRTPPLQGAHGPGCPSGLVGVSGWGWILPSRWRLLGPLAPPLSQKLLPLGFSMPTSTGKTPASLGPEGRPAWVGGARAATPVLSGPICLFCSDD